jgi:hypothetical protein
VIDRISAIFPLIAQIYVVLTTPDLITHLVPIIVRSFHAIHTSLARRLARVDKLADSHPGLEGLLVILRVGQLFRGRCWSVHPRSWFF